MSGAKALFLTGLIMANGLYVSTGYDALANKMQEVFIGTYDHPAVKEIGTCDKNGCMADDPGSQAIAESLYEIRSNYEQVLGGL